MIQVLTAHQPTARHGLDRGRQVGAATTERGPGQHHPGDTGALAHQHEEAEQRHADEVAQRPAR